MLNPALRGEAGRSRSASSSIQDQIPIEHYLRLLWKRKWVVLAVFALVSTATFVVTYRMPDVYTSETVILVDPQRVPETYVKATVSGDIRNRLGTLSQQILSATRLQKIIESLNLYAEERKVLAREDIINRMRGDIAVRVVSEFGDNQDLQAFRISYSGRDPRLVAQVTNQLASLFIEENLKAREQQATGTTEFLQNQLEETRKTLEEHESKVKDFKLRHIGELPQQETATLQVLGQLQSQMQIQADALSRAEQQKMYFESLAAQPAPVVVELDEMKPNAGSSEAPGAPGPPAALAAAKARLDALLSRYTESHPEVQKLKMQIADAEAAMAAAQPQAVEKKPEPPTTAAAVSEEPARRAPAAPRTLNPVVQSQLQRLDGEIAKYREEQRRLAKMIASYQSKLGAIPVREQELTKLVRDYEMSKSHYSQLLGNQLSAETATQLEIRQKSEKFTILDPAQVAEKPSRPNRRVLNTAGSGAGLVLGLLVAMTTELLGMSITTGRQITASTGLTVLEVIPMIQTDAGKAQRRRRRLLVAGLSGAVTVLALCVIALYRYRSEIF